MKTQVKWCIVGLSVMIVLGLVVAGCSWVEKDTHESPTEPQTAQETEVNIPNESRYDQSDHEESLEQTVDNTTYEIHISRDESWVCYPYGEWVYLEINKQVGTGQPAGTNQTDVEIQNVSLTFSNLAAGVTSIVFGLDTDPPNSVIVEEFSVPVSGSSVTVDLDPSYLQQAYGSTHYAIWFMLMGPENGRGCDDVVLTVTGTHTGQALSDTKDLKFGSENPCGGTRIGLPR